MNHCIAVIIILVYTLSASVVRARVGVCLLSCLCLCVSVSWSQIRLGPGSARIYIIWDRDNSGPGISVVTNIVFDLQLEVMSPN